MQLVDMPTATEQPLLDALLDSWDRNNTITVNLLRALPEGTYDLRPMAGSPSIGELFTHLHYVRMVFVAEDAPEFSREAPKDEWTAERDPARLVEMLNESAIVVRDAVKGRLAAAQAGRPAPR